MKKYQWILLLILPPIFSLPASLAATPQNPLLVNGALYVSNNGVHKFNRASLQLEWSVLQGMQTFQPVMGKNLLYVGSPQGLYALDPDTGQQLWRIEKTRTIFSPSVAGQLYAGSLHGELYSIDPPSGKINWRKQFTGWIYSPVVLADESQLWTGGQAHQAFAISAKDGRRLHTIMLDQESIFSPVDLQNQQIGFNLFNGKTTIINTVTAKIDGWLDGSTQPKNLTSDDNYIYRSGRDGTLSVFDRNSYRLLWQKSIVAQNLTMHPAQDGYILMSDLDKTLVLFDPDKRTEVWRDEISGNWSSPIQIDTKNVVYFRSTNLQPNELTAVKIPAQP